MPAATLLLQLFALPLRVSPRDSPGREGALARALRHGADRVHLAELPPHLRRDLGLPPWPPAPRPLPDGWR